MIEPDELASMLRAAFPGAEIEVRDLTGGRDHFEAVIVSDAFAGLPLVQRHRKVYEALGDAMKERIHALSLKTQTPGEKKNA